MTTKEKLTLADKMERDGFSMWMIPFVREMERKVESDQAQKKEQRQAIDNAHAEIYSVWNGAKRRLNPQELNHLEAALRILAELGYFDSHTGEGTEE
jgi:hypothetical protein